MFSTPPNNRRFYAPWNWVPFIVITMVASMLQMLVWVHVLYHTPDLELIFPQLFVWGLMWVAWSMLYPTKPEPEVKPAIDILTEQAYAGEDWAVRAFKTIADIQDKDYNERLAKWKEETGRT